VTEWSDGLADQVTVSNVRRPLARRIILNSIFKDKRRILLSMVTTLALTVALALLVTPKYKANATLLVLISSEYTSLPVTPATGAENVSRVIPERDAILKSEVEILSSPSLGKAVLHRIGVDRVYSDYAKRGWGAKTLALVSSQLRAAAAEFGLELPPPHAVNSIDLAALAFAKDLSVTPDKTGNIITVSFRHRDPTVAAAVVNTLIESYLVKRGGLFSDVTSPIAAEHVNALREELEKADREFTDFKAGNGISDYSLQREILLRQQGDVSHDLQRAESEIAQSAQRIAVLEHELKQTPQDVVEYGKTLSPILHGRPTVVDSLEIDRARANGDFEAAKARRDTDFAQLTQLRDSIKRLEANSLELERLDRKRFLIDQNYRSMIQRFDFLKFREEMNAKKVASIRIVQPAEIPVESGMLRIVILAAGLIICLFVGIVVALLSAVFRCGYISPEELERSLGLPVLARVPVLVRPPDMVGSPERSAWRPSTAPQADAPTTAITTK
jgi:uncharacterized protein involved in exopolysaccharide biosynthesis